MVDMNDIKFKTFQNGPCVGAMFRFFDKVRARKKTGTYTVRVRVCVCVCDGGGCRRWCSRTKQSRQTSNQASGALTVSIK